MATVSFKYWNDCVDPQDLEAMWTDPDVRAEWLNVGETMGSKVHLSRDPDGQPYLTQTEMKAVAGIIVRRHFISQIDSDMLCAIAELESGRQTLATQYNKKSKDCTMGIMQISPKTAEWLVRDLSYQNYGVDGDSKLLYKPFVNVYLGAAYLMWLSNFEQIERSEEFMVRAYKGGIKKATHKSTKQYWKKYLSVKETLPTRKVFEVAPVPNAPSASATGDSPKKGITLTTVLCAIAEIVSMRFVNGVGQRTGLMGIDYPTACWLYKDLGYKGYIVKSVEDLTYPFISMYFGAAYMAWLSEYEGRERSPQFVVQAYISGPQNVNLQETGPLWLKFQEALSRYEDTKKEQNSCPIL
ncbi:unnamed protein product [Fraxinus pennsylvanica]|uniref:Transglycosylase SLT domain-containing protein n=1 Tax=Fraxinus pennsylvanica TaxID=56036 RepID=A0AAD2EDH9_9LAMI|nr:unnamed protein product [Fraxinus pennsylvanica]